MSSLMRWNPFDELMSLWPRDLLGRLDPGGRLAVEWSPRCDVDETDTEIVVHAELPGVDPKDMDVSVHEGVLTIRGEKRSERKEANGKKGYTERFFGSFERSLTIPASVDEDKIEARMRDGVLEVRLPKAKQAEPAVRKIAITAA